MSKRTAYIVIIVVLIILCGGLFFAYQTYFKPGGTATSTGIGSWTDYLPFGNPSTAPDQTEGNSSGKAIIEGEATTTLNQDATNASNSISSTSPVPKLREISAGQISGAGVFNDDIFFVDKGNGHISQTKTDSLNVVQVSNTTIPRIYQALWLNSKNVFLRYIDDDTGTIKTLSGTLPATSTLISTATSTAGTVAELTGLFFPDNIFSLALAPTGNQLFYLAPGSNGASKSGAVGIITSANGQGRTQVFSSAVSEWQPQWVNQNTISVTSNAAAGSAGSQYFINTKTGAMAVGVNNVNGLTTLTNPTADTVLYSQSDNNSVTLYTLNRKTGAATSLVIGGLPEKCVWSMVTPSVAYCAIPVNLPAGNYPDDWYQGKMSFNDDIWKINTATGVNQKIFDAGDQKAPAFDAINLSLNQGGDTLIFTNKKDDSLWSLNVGN